MFNFNSSENFKKKINQFKKDEPYKLKNKIWNLKNYSRNYSSIRFFKEFSKYVN